MILPPESQSFDIIQVEKSKTPTWSVNFSLFETISGVINESDLTVELTIVHTDNEIFSFSIDNIHVL